MSEIWQDFLDIIRKEMGSRVVETWFKAISLDQWDMNSRRVYLVAPNAFVRDWVQKNYMGAIRLHLGRLLNVQDPTVFIETTSKESQGAHEKQDAATSAISIVPACVAQGKKTAVVKKRNKQYINKVYSFDTFVVGPSNSLAYAAAHAVTENPGTLYNPLLMYGKSGLGKTHLLHSIGNQIKVRFDHNVLYQTADRFVTEFINAIRFNKVHSFKQRYQKIDVLLIDDMQFISKKEHTQEAFFHIFNSLYEAGKQLVFTSDTYPDDIEGIAVRLRSRLSSGLVTDIDQPGIETKIAILKKKALLNNENLDDDVAHFIAMQGSDNIRELEGLLIRVMAFGSLTKQPLSLDLAKRVFARAGTTQSTQYQRQADFSSIMSQITKQTGYSFQELCSKSRSKDIVQTRQIAMFLMKKYTEKSLRDIGIFLGGRDHSTVMHGVSKIEEQLSSHEGLKERVRVLEAAISPV